MIYETTPLLTEHFLMYQIIIYFPEQSPRELNCRLMFHNAMFTFLLRSARDLMVSVDAVDAVTRRRVASRARAGTELWDGRIASEDTEPGPAQETPLCVSPL